MDVNENVEVFVPGDRVVVEGRRPRHGVVVENHCDRRDCGCVQVVLDDARNAERWGLNFQPSQLASEDGA